MTAKDYFGWLITGFTSISDTKVTRQVINKYKHHLEEAVVER